MKCELNHVIILYIERYLWNKVQKTVGMIYFSLHGEPLQFLLMACCVLPEKLEHLLASL